MNASRGRTRGGALSAVALGLNLVRWYGAGATGRRPARGLRDFAPKVREGAARRIAAPDQDLQLASEQR